MKPLILIPQGKRLTLKEAKEMVKRYREKHPDIAKWWDKLSKNPQEKQK
jgi:hypothetical protein